MNYKQRMVFKTVILSSYIVALSILWDICEIWAQYVAMIIFIIFVSWAVSFLFSILGIEASEDKKDEI